MNRAIQLLAVLALVGCGGSNSNDESASDAGADGGDFFATSCVSISGGDVEISSGGTNCPSCEVSNELQAADGDFNTYADTSAPVVSAGTVRFRVTAQTGLIFPSGSNAGVVAGISRSSTIENGSFSIRTYLEDVLQEEHTISNNVLAFNGASAGGRTTYAFETTKQFNAVEMRFTGSANDLEIAYFEFCSDN